MDSNSEDGGCFIQDCPSQQDATQYRVMYSHDRNTKQVCCGARCNAHTNTVQTCTMGTVGDLQTHVFNLQGEELNKKRWARHSVELNSKCSVFVSRQ